ncbi:hypothetical protein MKW92_047449 [Papaver armeniacum]|nr:hypothetical protein MKW92_047449 [Papaver armeniacum]
MAPGLYEASVRGDVNLLNKLLKDNPHLPLDEKLTGRSRTALHIAAMCGHVKFAGELLRINRQPATDKDLHGFTPLHLASARTSLSMVKQLLDSNKEVCMEQDEEGRTPLHFAAMNDRVNIIKELIKQKPEAIHIRNHQNETVLHLCVKHDSLKSLKLLLEELPSVGAPTLNMDALSVNSTNSDGNTILHLAAEMGRMKFIKYLVDGKNIGIVASTLNNNGVKALHLIPETEKDNSEIGCYDMRRKRNPSQGRWMIEALVVVATLIAGITFQAAMTPPGGVFQEDSKIKASENPVIFTYYLRSVAKSTKSGRFGRYLDQQELTQRQNLMNSTDFLQELLNTLDNDTYSAYSPYMMGKSPGIVLTHEDWNKVISKYKLRFSPYLIRYAGTPILAYKNPRIYNLYMTYNAIAFLVSLSIIVLVIISLSIIIIVISGLIDRKDNNTRNHQVRVLTGMLFSSITAWLLSFVSVFMSMSPPFYINRPLLSQVFIMSVVIVVISAYVYKIFMTAKHWIKIQWWKIMHKDGLIDQFQKEDSELNSGHIIQIPKAVFPMFMPVLYLIVIAILSLPFLYSYTN